MMAQTRPSLLPRPPARQLQRTAVHEAGHAVAALALGQGIRVVSIRPTGVCRGTTVLGPPDVTDPVAQATISAAGDVAADLVRQGAPTPDREAGPWLDSWLVSRELAAAIEAHASLQAGAGRGLDFSDAAKLRSAAGDGHERDVRAHTAAARIRAREILTRAWPAVYQLADALLERGQIDGKNIDVRRAAGGSGYDPGLRHSAPLHPAPATRTRSLIG